MRTRIWQLDLDHNNHCSDHPDIPGYLQRWRGRRLLQGIIHKGAALTAGPAIRYISEHECSGRHARSRIKAKKYSMARCGKCLFLINI